MINNSKYTYNESNDTYVIPVKHRTKSLVLKGFRLRGIRRALTSFLGSPSSVKEVAQRFNLLEEDIDAIKKAMDITRDCGPWTQEEIDNETSADLALVALREKESVAAGLVEKTEWKHTQEDANRWRAFKEGSLDVYKLVLEDWTAPKSIASIAIKKGGPKRSLVFVISDLHIGGKLEKAHSVTGRDWGTAQFKEFLKSYKEQMAAQLRTQKYDKVVVNFLGDILDGIRGKTEKGIILNPEIVRDAQFKLALDSIVDILNCACKHSSAPIEVHNVKGNHDSVDCYMLFAAVGAHFKGVKNFKFNNHTKNVVTYVDKGNLFVLTHGAHDTIKAKLPYGPKQESYVQSLIIQAVKDGQKFRHTTVLAGDVHVMQSIERNDYELIVCGSPSASDYADALNLKNRPSQIWLGVTERGVEQIGRFYFDS